MTKMSAAFAAAMKVACVLAGLATVAGTLPAKADWKAPWKSDDKALVIDAYEFNPINWSELASDKRIAGFINKASDGLPPEWNCGSAKGDDYKLCKNRWWKYSVTKELYMTRREMAKMKGLLWGAYHLGRPGNPRAQADHFVDFAEPGPDDLIALDIEDNNSEWMSLGDAEIFADQVKIRTGRYPVLYTNGSTAKFISERRETYPLLSRLPLWYARYRDDITGKFPTDTWPTYALWQFSSMHNCSTRSCPYRVKGAKTDIDVNVASLDVAGLRAAWPFDKLIERPSDEAEMLVADVTPPAATKNADGIADNALVAAYGPVEHKGIDPLQLLSEAAHAERKPEREVPALVPLAAAPAASMGPEVAQKLGAHWTALRAAISAAKSEIGAFFVSKAEAATPPAGPHQGRERADNTLKGAVKSRFVDMLREAQAAASDRAETRSDASKDERERGARVVPVEYQPFVGPASPVQRLALAFAATR